MNVTHPAAHPHLELDFGSRGAGKQSMVTAGGDRSRSGSGLQEPFQCWCHLVSQTLPPVSSGAQAPLKKPGSRDEDQLANKAES